MNEIERHDIKNQLGIVLGFTELMLEDTPASDGRYADLQEVRRAAEECLALVDGQAPEGSAATTASDADATTAQTALLRSTERFELAARATHDTLWDWDMQTNAIWWNEGFYQMFGYGRDIPMKIEFWLDLIHPEDLKPVEHSLETFLASVDESWHGEYRFRHANGHYVWVLDRGFVVRNPELAPLRMIGSMMDVSTRKDAERMKSDFVAFVSHQLRTPLAGISWMLELAGDVPQLPSAATSYIADAQESAQRLVDLVNDLLDVSRLEGGKPTVALKPVDLAAMTQSVVDECRQLIDDKQHQVSLTVAGPIAPVTADPQLLRQAVLNLFSNAIKYTPAGGRISIAIDEQDGQLRWAVTDTGIGIAKAAQSRLFEKFFRAENAVSLATEGTGLGLHLVRLIIQQFGGEVSCDSDEGRGATFTFTLPRTETP